MTMSVIVPVYNCRTAFRACLNSLVVADGDRDASGRFPEHSRRPGIHFPSPGARARVRNFGASKEIGNIVWLIDAVVRTPSSIMQQVTDLFQREPGLAAVIGSDDNRPVARNVLSQYRNPLHHHVHQTGREEASTFWGACGAIERTVFEAVGGFDETYRTPSIEDIEIGYRLKGAGYRIRLVKTLQVTHWKRWILSSIMLTDAFRRALPWTELILSHRSVLNDLNLQLSGRISALLAGTMVVGVGVVWWWSWAIVIVGLAMAGLLALNH
jgi:hypothetical protein